MTSCSLNTWSWKRILVCGIFAAAGMYGVFTTPNIRDYRNDTDRQALLQHFKDDFYWLSDGPFDAERMLDTHSAHGLRYDEKFHMKVLLDRGEVAGFVTYFPVTFRKGEIQFVSVGRKFRGKGYGKILTRYAVNALFAMGCSEVRLATRINNKWSRHIYHELGFRELGFIDKLQPLTDGLIDLKITR